MQALLIPVAYLLGSIPAGVLIVKWVTGLDVRRHGSGNIGTANAIRVSGWKVGVMVLLADIAKGALPVFIARTLGAAPIWVSLTGLAAVAGHNWSVFLRGRGGKGVATTLGVMLVLGPKVVGILAIVWVILVAVTRYSSVGSITCLLLLPVVAWAAGLSEATIFFSLVAGAIGIIRHRSNITRLIQGRENKITQRSSQS